MKEELEELSKGVERGEDLKLLINISNQALEEVELTVEEGEGEIKSREFLLLPLAMVEHERAKGK